MSEKTLVEIRDRLAELADIVNRELSKPEVKPLVSNSKLPEAATFTEAELNTLPWKPQTSKKGEWVFKQNRDGSASSNPLIRRLREKLEKEGDTKMYSRTYKLSGDSFIARYPL